MKLKSLIDSSGYALCCGVVPVVDVFRGKAHCSICEKQKEVRGGKGFLRTRWNEMFQTGRGAASVRSEHVPLTVPVLHGRPGYRTCRTCVEMVSFGHTDTFQVEDCLFLCADKDSDMLYAHDDIGYSCAIDDGRHIHDIRLENIEGRELHLQWLDRKRYPYSYVYATTGCCTDGTFSWNINVHSTRSGDWKRILEWIGKR